jgi:hypothetical protein
MATRQIALDRVSYFGTIISENIARTPDGYLICRNCVIGRSGFQTYRVSEITDPEGLLKENDRDLRGDEELDLWRDPSEVFSDATLASFEGKTFTVTHPEDLLNPETEKYHHAGHIQNVRKGTETLDRGDWPMLADIIVTDADAIRAIDTGARELSCGYTYKLARNGYKWEQRQIIGNHVALVPQGRAGSEARIYDAAPKESIVNFRTIFGGWSKTAKQEDIDAALEDKTIVSALAGTSIAKDAVDHKPAPSQVITPDANGFVVLDGKKFKAVDGMEEENRAAGDKRAADRKKLHDALDMQLDAKEQEEAEKSKEAEDAAAELKNMFASKDAADADKHPEGCRCEDCKDKGKDKAKDAEEEERKKKEEEEKSKDSWVVYEEPKLPEGDRPKSVFDAVRTMDALKTFRVVVAQSADKRVKAAFDALYQGLKAEIKEIHPNGGSYSSVRKAASEVGKDHKIDPKDKEFKPRVSEAEVRAAAADKVYADAGNKLMEKLSRKK